MKSNKGFTLIELLAVIVVLAIIALIATPVVLNSISTAKEGANRESARAFVKAAEFWCAQQQMTASPTIVTSKTNTTGITVKGTAPAAVNLTFPASGSCVASGTVTIGTQAYTIGAAGNYGI